MSSRLKLLCWFWKGRLICCCLENDGLESSKPKALYTSPKLLLYLGTIVIFLFITRLSQPWMNNQEVFNLFWCISWNLEYPLKQIWPKYASHDECGCRLTWETNKYEVNSTRSLVTKPCLSCNVWSALDLQLSAVVSFGSDQKHRCRYM